ncbi:hypothetical protein JB92DRAFT_2744156 [Gautieria morchelliformis]|nr:hypothetical protein JB92DRAFT_2744156 [Gautieria morchelliformis]
MNRFSKLYMSHLATEFEKQAHPRSRRFYQIRRKLTYGTICQECHQRSERDTNFLELEISLETNAKMTSSGTIGRDVTVCRMPRYTKLRRLPPVLHFSVLRFVSLPSLSRKKSKQAIQFPSILLQVPTKRQHSDPIEATDLIYELRGVLLHKASSAYHGHYEAPVFDVMYVLSQRCTT